MELVVILQWIKNNWKLLVGALIVLVVLGLFAFTFYKGYGYGKAGQLAVDQKVIDDIKQAAQIEHDRLQADADAKSKEYETARTKFSSTLATVKRKLTNAEIANSSYNTCHAGPEFMQLYSEAAGATAAGNTTRQPHP